MTDCVAFGKRRYISYARDVEGLKRRLRYAFKRLGITDGTALDMCTGKWVVCLHSEDASVCVEKIEFYFEKKVWYRVEGLLREGPILLKECFQDEFECAERAIDRISDAVNAVVLSFMF